MPDLPGVTHVVITVSDLSTSVPWYPRLIGSDPGLDEDTGPFRPVVFAVGDGATPRPRHIAFGCANRDELAGRQTRLEDPNNIALEFLAPPAG